MLQMPRLDIAQLQMACNQYGKRHGSEEEDDGD
jgi:hypothetical protein